MAAASASLHVQGLNKVVRQLGDLGVETADMKAAMSKGSRILADSLRRETPKRSGRLAANVRPGVAKARAVARVGNNGRLVYGAVQAYARKSPHRGYQQRALKNASKAAFNTIARELNRLIHTHGF